MNSQVVVFLGVLATVLAYPTSVPPTAGVCKNMVPGHGPKPQRSQAPYEVDTDITRVVGGSKVKVTLRGVEDAQFIGYYVQARDENNSPIGSFQAVEGVAKTHNCGGIKNNGVHHANKEDKSEVELSWTAPRDYTGAVTFTATFVEEFEKFWTLVKSNSVQVTMTLGSTDSTRSSSSSKEETRQARTIAFPASKPTGAKIPEVCGKWKPQHEEAESSNSNYVHTLTAASTPNGIEVTIKATSPTKKFKGFLIRARVPKKPEPETLAPLGTWKASDPLLAHPTTCFNVPDNLITHQKNTKKESVTGIWTPPKGYKGPIEFVATIVESFAFFYYDLVSATITV